MWNIEKVIKKGDYEYALVPNHPKATKNGYVLMHRIVVENRLGRLLLPEEVVHHKDHNRKNNSPDNLEVMTNAEHVRMHQSTGNTMVEQICKECGRSFQMKVGQTKKGQTNFFCSRSCNGKYQRKNNWTGRQK